jgi:hypothetical protein
MNCNLWLHKLPLRASMENLRFHEWQGIALHDGNHASRLVVEE